MIRNVSITNYLGETLDISIEDPEKSGFLIYNIDGLNPGKATINTTEMSTGDGSLYNSARFETRNVVLGIILLGNPDIETSRHMLYRFFSVKKKIRLTFKTDNRECYIDGYVESNELSLFSKQAAAQISVLCPDPYFYSVQDSITTFYGIDGGFEFPFENDSLVSPTLEFGEIVTNSDWYIYYDGDAEVGMVIRIHAKGPASNITIYNTETKESLKIDSEKLKTLTGSDIVKDDEIIISTVRRDKRISLLRNGVTTNILNALNRDADWIQLKKGDNVLAYTASKGVENLQFQTENKVAYEGV